MKSLSIAASRLGTEVKGSSRHPKSKRLWVKMEDEMAEDDWWWWNWTWKCFSNVAFIWLLGNLQTILTLLHVGFISTISKKGTNNRPPMNYSWVILWSPCSHSRTFNAFVVNGRFLVLCHWLCIVVYWLTSETLYQDASMAQATPLFLIERTIHVDTICHYFAPSL